MLKEMIILNRGELKLLAACHISQTLHFFP